MNILINFSTLKKGGGQNVALNFLSTLYQLNEEENNFYFIVAKNSAIHFLIKKKMKSNYYVFPQNPILRIFFEICTGKRILKNNKIDIIYSYFGYGVFRGKIPQVTGAVDSNILFPEINFWEGYKGLNLIKRRLIDIYRKWGLKHAKGIIFENITLENRFHKLFFTNALSTTIKPSIKLDYHKKEFILPKEIENVKKGLFLCGWHLNKNVLIIPLIAHLLKKMNIIFHFILTAPNDYSYIHKQFISLINKYDVAEYISIVGSVLKEELYSLYQQIDYVFLLSRLESFSNNIIEAWSYKKAIIITDALWARSICDNAAIYVDRDDASNIALQIDKLLSNNVLSDEIIKNGVEKLKEYPNIEEKTKSELNFIKKVYEYN